MSRLRDVQAELTRMRKELAEKEAEIRRKKAEPLADILRDAVLNDDDACEKLLAYNKEDTRVIAKYFAWNMERIIAESGPEIEALRAKRAARAARRRTAAKERTA